MERAQEAKYSESKYEIGFFCSFVFLEKEKEEEKGKALNFPFFSFSLSRCFLSFFYIQTAAATPPLCAAIRSRSSLDGMGEVFPLPLPPPKKLEEEEEPLPLPPLPVTAERTPPSPIAEVETWAPRRMGGCW